MKKTTLYKTMAVAFFATILLSECKKIDQLTKFEIDYESDITFQSGLPLNIPITLYSPDVATNSEEEFSINDTRKDLIESIKLIRLRLVVISPPGQTLAFLKNVSIYISSTDLPETRVAFKDNIDDNVGTELLLDVTDAELREYIKAESFKLKVSGTTDQTLLNDITLRAYSTFFVDAKILGI